MRALRSGHDLALESLRFSSEEAYQELLRAQRRAQSLELPPCPVSTAVASDCLATLDLWQRSSALHRFISPKLLVSEQGLLIQAEVRPAMRIPWASSGEVLELQTRVTGLVDLLTDVPNLFSYLLPAWQQRQLLAKGQTSEGHLWYTELFLMLESFGFIREGVLTDKGLAAASIRATEAPQVFVEACLSGDALDGSELRALASLLCGSGKEVGAESPLLRARVPGELLRTLQVSEARLQEAVSQWAEGKSLASIWAETGAPPETLAKHLVRCCDLLSEAGGALRTMAPTIAQCLDEARAPLVRGLPFLQLQD
jgi:hypothetical protein